MPNEGIATDTSNPNQAAGSGRSLAAIFLMYVATTNGASAEQLREAGFPPEMVANMDSNVWFRPQYPSTLPLVQTAQFNPDADGVQITPVQDSRPAAAPNGADVYIQPIEDWSASFEGLDSKGMQDVTRGISESYSADIQIMTNALVVIPQAGRNEGVARDIEIRNARENIGYMQGATSSYADIIVNTLTREATSGQGISTADVYEVADVRMQEQNEAIRTENKAIVDRALNAEYAEIDARPDAELQREIDAGFDADNRRFKAYDPDTNGFRPLTLDEYRDELKKEAFSSLDRNALPGIQPERNYMDVVAEVKAEAAARASGALTFDPDAVTSQSMVAGMNNIMRYADSNGSGITATDVAGELYSDLVAKGVPADQARELVERSFDAYEDSANPPQMRGDDIDWARAANPNYATTLDESRFARGAGIEISPESEQYYDQIRHPELRGIVDDLRSGAINPDTARDRFEQFQDHYDREMGELSDLYTNQRTLETGQRMQEFFEEFEAILDGSMPQQGPQPINGPAGGVSGIQTNTI